MDRFGFIVTRCVNEPYNDLLWKECIMCIRKVYPSVKIIIIDDHSEISVDESALDVNISVVKSTYKKGCGELLPYLYFYSERYFHNAIIIHDSVMLMQPFDDDIFNDHDHVHFVWYFHEYTSCLSINSKTNIQTMLNTIGINMDIVDNFPPYLIGCFGTMSIISLELLTKIYMRFPLNNLIFCINGREDRCILERVFAIICFVTCGELKSVYHNIRDPLNVPLPFEMNYEMYCKNKETLKQHNKIVKLWCGR